MTADHPTPAGSMYEERYWAAQKALDEILGPDEEGGAGEGLVAEIWLVANQRDEALAELARRDAALVDLTRQRDEAVAAAKSAIDEALALAEAQLRVIDQRDAAQAQLERQAPVIDQRDNSWNASVSWPRRRPCSARSTGPASTRPILLPPSPPSALSTRRPPHSRPDTGRRAMGDMTAEPNFYGCHDPQCLDSTWDHECPVTPDDAAPLHVEDGNGGDR